MVRISLTFALLIAAGPACALNMTGFKDAPLTRLTGEELKAFRAAVMKTLDETPEGTTIEWKAPKTEFTSRITPGRSFTADNQQCREATIDSKARDLQQRGVYTFCKPPKGEWQFWIPGGK